MPIRSENRHYYKTPELKAAKEQVKLRANGVCEQCGVPNKAIIVCCPHNNWATMEQLIDGKFYCCNYFPGVDDTTVKIVLTVAHIDQNPANNALENLKHLCQRCHNRLDMPFRIAGRKRRALEKQRQLELPLELP
jgi:5-methylcytosine-specific restriction endonuclease McrA